MDKCIIYAIHYKGKDCNILKNKDVKIMIFK